MIVGPYHEDPCGVVELEDEGAVEYMNRIGREYGYPPALQKACCDPFDYAMGMRNGLVFRFCEASPVSREWVFVDGIKRAHEMHGVGEPVPFENMTMERGMYVRVAEIAWVADGPNGS